MISPVAAFDPHDPDVKPDQYTELVYVTHQWAEDALSRNVGNRRISEMHVRIWEERYNKGRYRLTHQGIAFDREGYLNDGQHHLHGFQRSKSPGFWTSVTYNVDRASFAAIDGGILRAPAQLIDGGNADKKAAAARMLLQYPRISLPTQRVETEDVLEAYRALQEFIDPAVDMAGQVYRATKINIPMLAATLSVPMSTGYATNKILDFVAGVSEGAGLEADDARLALRNRYTVEASHLNKSDRLSGAYFIIRAWNAYARGESLTKLQRPRGGKVLNSDLPEVES